MKRILKMAALALVIMLGSAWRNNAAAQPSADDEVSYQTFYDELSPHGRWVDYPQHGYVWIPDAGPDFRPYSTNGHWVYTDDYEWMWVSDYDWGWAPFHYGRWDHDPYYGWYWVPGYEWSPAWVAWRDGGDYYGWAPIRPGISISINFSIGGYSPPYDFWCFTPRRYITSYNVYNYCMPRTNNITIINQTTIINNYNYRGNVWRTGPRRMDAEVYCGRISPVRFRSMSSPGRSVFRNNEVSVYRPSVRRDERGFAPRTFERYDRNNGRNNNGRFDRRDNNQGSNGRIDTRDRRTGRFEGSNSNGNSNGRFERNGAPDNRDRRTNGRIGGNSDNGANNGRNNNGRFERNNTNTPNTPGDTRDRRSNNRFERNNTNTPTPGNNNGPTDRRSIFERNGNGNGGGNNDGRIFRQQRTDQPSQPSTNPRGNGGSNDGRMYRQQRTEQPSQPSQPSMNPGGNGRFDRRMSNPGNQSSQPRVEPRRMENNNRMQMPERRTEQRSAPSSQPRFEPRSNDNNNRSSGNGNGGERSRRGRNG